MGSFLLLTLLHKPLISKQLNHEQWLNLHTRFYRLNIVLCLLGGITAALINYQETALLLAIVAVSYVFTNMHILRGINKHTCTPDSTSPRALRSLKFVQNLIHFLQFFGAGCAVYYLN